MAYQFVNADQLNADLTSVANAIRTKSKMAVKLQFPGGMANAISGISTGVELNFEVVYGQTAPADPKENTIWICTSFMTDWYFQPAQPENMQPGDVWISTGTAGAVAFNALKQNSILVCPISAKQMLGDGIMEDVAAKTWRNGAWHEWIPEGALYYKGSNIGGLVTTGYGTIGAFSSLSNVSAVFESDNVSIVTTGYTNEPNTNGDRSYGYLGTPTAIDLTNVETISVIGTVKSYSNNERILLMVSQSKSVGTSGQIADTCLSTGTLSGEILKLDVSALDGSYYVFYMQFDAADVDIEQFVVH